MMHVTPEGGFLRRGLNFYPWRERRYSIGLRVKAGSQWLQLRYAPHVRRLYLGPLALQF